jgi:hypothetical protein
MPSPYGYAGKRRAPTRFCAGQKRAHCSSPYSPFMKKTVCSQARSDTCFGAEPSLMTASTLSLTIGILCILFRQGTASDATSGCVDATLADRLTSRGLLLTLTTEQCHLQWSLTVTMSRQSRCRLHSQRPTDLHHCSTLTWDCGPAAGAQTLPVTAYTWNCLV